MNWEDEKACFEGFLKELAFFYSPRPFESPEPIRRKNGVMTDGEDMDVEEEFESGDTKEEREHELWQIQHVLFPSFRRYTTWPVMGKDVVTQVANLPDLFRIFERC